LRPDSAEEEKPRQRTASQRNGSCSREKLRSELEGEGSTAVGNSRITRQVAHESSNGGGCLTRTHGLPYCSVLRSIGGFDLDSILRAKRGFCFFISSKVPPG